MKPSTIQTAGLLFYTSLLLTACSPPSPAPQPPGPVSPKVGLGVGVTNAVSCHGAGGTRNAPATAITLALRDGTGQPITAGSNNVVTLSLKTPDGTLYSFKNPYNPDTDDEQTFQASENYFILCAAPLSGNYVINGTVNTQAVSDTQPLVASSAPNAPGNATLRVQGLSAAEAEFAAPPQTQAALVNYYRGNQSNTGVYSGYRVAFGAKSAANVPITPAVPEKPRRKCEDECQQRNQEQSEKLPEAAAPNLPPAPPGQTRQRIVRPDLVRPQGGGLIWSSGAVFGQAVAAPTGLRPQALSGPQTVPLALPGGHMQGEPYYAEIITSDTVLGAATTPESLGRVDLNVAYTPVVTPPDQNAAAWTARLSAAPMTVKNIVEKPYESLTTSLITKDGFPSARTWDVSVRGPSGAEVWTYTYPAFTPYVLTAAPGQQAAGSYTADFTAPGIGARTQTFAVAGSTPLKVPDDANLSLNPDLKGFTFVALSGPRSHWVYVSEDGSGTLVASRTCIVGAAERCIVEKRPGVTLSTSKRYFLTLVSTEAPLDLHPLLAGTDWNFAQPIRWATQFKDAATNPAQGPFTGELLLADVKDLKNRSIESGKTVQFGTFDKTNQNPLTLKDVNWKLVKLSRPDIVTVDAANGLVTGTGTDLGRFTVEATYQGKASQSEEFAVFGLVCTGGKAAGGASLLCKFRDAQGKVITNLPYTVQAAGWNNDQPFQIDQEAAQGALAFAQFVGPLLSSDAKYTFKVTAQGKTFTDTANIDPNAMGMDEPVAQLEREDSRALSITVDAAFDAKSARVDLACVSGCDNNFAPVIVPLNGGPNLINLDVDLPKYDADIPPRLEYRVTAYNTDLTQADSELPFQFQSATTTNTFFICAGNIVKSSCP